MQKAFCTTSFVLFSFFSLAQIEGKWQTIDDNTGRARSVVEIFQRNNQFFGRIVKIFQSPNEKPDPVCDKCSTDDPRYNMKVVGMEILEKLIKKDNEYTDGMILDPENGKVYRCKLWIEENVLKVRGYWGPFFRTQTWHRDRSTLEK
ncbi:MAG: DUF2147 domain-containing protein [Bacteroidetes bacterium]|nr:DUF2147 domain-containing protein [Bacteroidota bacterium]MBS1541229.1 DUF2147 domain-containing protein [Bacteroidota bacterium]